LEVVHRRAVEGIVASLSDQVEIAGARILRRVVDRHHLDFLDILHIVDLVDGSLGDGSIHAFFDLASTHTRNTEVVSSSNGGLNAWKHHEQHGGVESIDST